MLIKNNIKNKKKVVKKKVVKKKVVKKKVVKKKVVKKKVGSKQKISQICISSAIVNFKNKFINKYKLKKYTSKKLPTIFFGLYGIRDFKKIKAHQSLRIIIFGGTDLKTISTKRNLVRYRNMIKFLQSKKVKCVAISKCLSRILTSLKIKHYNIRFNLIDTNLFKPCKMGNCVYVYTNPKRHHIYGSSIYTQVIKKLPKIKFIIAHCKSYNQVKLANIYKKCFIGLRLTSYDGNANTVQELGLCGIKCIHNGDSPNAIPWKNANDIVKSILNEKINIGKVNVTLSNKVADYYKVHNNRPPWLNTNFYR